MNYWWNCGTKTSDIVDDLSNCYELSHKGTKKAIYPSLNLNPNQPRKWKSQRYRDKHSMKYAVIIYASVSRRTCFEYDRISHIFYWCCQAECQNKKKESSNVHLCQQIFITLLSSWHQPMVYSCWKWAN